MNMDETILISPLSEKVYGTLVELILTETRDPTHQNNGWRDYPNTVYLN